MDENEVESRLRSLEAALRVFGVAVVLVLGSLALRTAALTPKFNQIFKDMLGSVDRLPAFTKLVIGAASNPLVFLGVPLLILIAGVFAGTKLPRRPWGLVYAACAGTLFLIWVALVRALYLPMLQIIQGVTGVTGP